MLDQVVTEITRVLDLKREAIAKDPPSVSPARLMDVISSQVEEIHDVLSPTPITVQMTGLRIKLPYDTFAPVLKGIVIEEEVTIGEVAEILPSTDAGLYSSQDQAVLRDEYHGVRGGGGSFTMKILIRSDLQHSLPILLRCQMYLFSRGIPASLRNDWIPFIGIGDDFLLCHSFRIDTE